MRNNRRNNRNNRSNNGIKFNVPTALISFEFSGSTKLTKALVFVLALLAVWGFSTNRYFGIEDFLRDYKHVENVTQITEHVRFVEEVYPTRMSYFVDDLNLNCSAADTESTVTFKNPLTKTKLIFKSLY